MGHRCWHETFFPSEGGKQTLACLPMPIGGICLENFIEKHSETVSG